MDGLGGLDDGDDADLLDDEEDDSWQSATAMPHAVPTTEHHIPAHAGGSPPLVINPPAMLAQHSHISPLDHGALSHSAPFPENASLGHGVESAADPQLDLSAQFSEEPDYVKAIELVLELSRRQDFKEYAELRDDDDDCLVNMVQAIKTWSRGQPHRRH